MRALELNSITASCAPLSTSPFTKALLPLITACCAPLVLPIDPDSSRTSATRVSQWGARAWFAVLGSDREGRRGRGEGSTRAAVRSVEPHRHGARRGRRLGKRGLHVLREGARGVAVGVVVARLAPAAERIRRRPPRLPRRQRRGHLDRDEAPGRRLLRRAAGGGLATGTLWSFASTSVAETFVTVGLARPTAVNQSNAPIASRPTKAGSAAQRRRPLLIASPGGASSPAIDSSAEAYEWQMSEGRSLALSGTDMSSARSIEGGGAGGEKPISWT